MAEATDTTTTTTTTTAKPWYDGVAGVDNEIVGHWTNRGWHNKTPAEVALEATKAWKAAEKFVGVPAEQVIRVPKEASDEAGWNTVWTRLGKPADAKGYDFTAIKRADGTNLDADTEAFIRDQSFKLHLTKDAATAYANEWIKREDGAKSSAAAETAAKLIEEKAALAKNWGQNFEANKFVAGRAAAALGIDPETVTALENQVGYAKVMEMFRAIGARIGEDKFVMSGSQDGNRNQGPMSRDQAIARKADLMKDQIWVAAYLKGDTAKAREMTALNTIIVGQQAA